MDFKHRRHTWLWLAIVFTAALLVVASIVVFSLPALSASYEPQAGWTFTGNVYEGLAPDASAPLKGVAVTLYGSDSTTAWGTLLASTNTDAAGAYSLNTTLTFAYYHLVETDLAGYYSTGSQAGTGGTAINYNWIRYQAPTSATYGGNQYWDRRPATPTPTETPETPTATPTYEPYPTYTPTPTTTGQVPNEADLTVSKSVVTPTSPTLLPGALVEYQVTITNKGPALAAGVVATDTLPSGFNFELASTGCTLVVAGPPNDVVRCQTGDLSPGQSISHTIKATVQHDACGRASNRVEVKSRTPDPVSWNNTTFAYGLIAPCNVPGVMIEKRQVDPSGYSAELGEIITYAIEITNIGSTTLSAVELVETFETERLAFVDSSPLPNRIDVNGTGSEMTWWDLTAPSPTGFGRSLPPGGSFIVYVQARADQSGYGYDCAHVGASAGDNPLVTDSDCFGTSITVPNRDFIVSKRLAYPPGGVAYVGQSLTYMVSLKNNGSTPITGIRLRDEYNTTYLSYSHAAYQPDSSANDGVLDWTNLTQPEPKGFGQPLPSHSSRGFSVSFSAKAATPPGQPTENCVQAWYWHNDQVEHDAGRFCLPVRIQSRNEPQVEIDKILLVPIGGVANAADPVKFAFRVVNTGTTQIKNLKLTDTYDSKCLRFIPLNDPSHDPDNLADDGALDWAHWLGTLSLQPGGSILIGPAVQFQAKAGACDPTTNTLQVVATDQSGKQATATALANLRIPAEPLALPDLGDAPTKFNHAGVDMTAYPGVVAQYPTVYDPAVGAQGPMHQQPRNGAWLGEWVSREQDADTAPDEDGLTNLSPAANQADRDLADDGMMAVSPLFHCQSATVTFRVTVPAGAPPDAAYFLNAWFDWNRDGEWGDQLACDSVAADEWTVKNFILPAGLAPGVHTFTTPGFLPWNATPKQPVWLRLTLGDRQATQSDGSGPVGGYTLGETEDYLLPGKDLPVTPTPTPTPSATLTPTITPSATPTPTPTREAACIPLYLPVLLHQAAATS